MPDAGQYRPAHTTTNTTNSPPDNFKAAPVDATDNSFAQPTTSKTSSTEEGNYTINDAQSNIL